MKYLLLSLLLISGSAHSVDHLVPEESIYSGGFYLEDYNKLVAYYLRDAYAQNVNLRVIVTPSFSPEYALGVKHSEGRHQIFYMAPEIHLWGYQMMPMMESGAVQTLSEDGEWTKNEDGLAELRNLYPDDPDDIPRVYCEADIPAQTASSLEQIWMTLLKGVKYPDSASQKRDGETYHFSMPVQGFTAMAGSAWSPKPESTLFGLVALTKDMRAYCLDSDNRKNKKALMSSIAQFSQTLETSKAKQ